MENIDKSDASDMSSSTDTDSETDELDESGQHKHRGKRSIGYCGCDSTENNVDYSVRVVWPPPESAGPSSSYTTWRNLRHVKFGDPLFGTRMQLYCKTGCHLAIYPNGRIRGVREEDNIYTLLEIISALYPGHVRIKGIVTNLYVSMNKRGRLYGEAMYYNEDMQGNPPTGNRMQLFCSNGYNLTVRPDGTILGTYDDTDSDSHLEITNAGALAHVQIRSLTNGLYVCFNEDGKLYGECDPGNPGTVFKENIDGYYSVYRSIAYPDWYVGIKKNGLCKPGQKTFGGQRAVKFLPRRAQFE